VLRAENGNDAVMLARSKRPDLIILDIVMPGLGGGEVAAMLRENPMTKDIPIIFQTCIISKTEETVACSLIAGNMFIAKPYSAEEMLAQVRKLA
jgi:two-component system sensor histidine kinase/response regulator